MSCLLSFQRRVVLMVKRCVIPWGQSGGYIKQKVFQNQPINHLLNPRYLDHMSKELPICDMEKFVLYLQKLNSSDGQPKYPFLVLLFKSVLSISYGNSAPENGFSIIKVAGFKSANLLKSTLLHGCSSRILNCTNGTKIAQRNTYCYWFYL